jgi:hypothetical protein
VVNYFSQIGGNEKYFMNINIDTTPVGNFVELRLSARFTSYVLKNIIKKNSRRRSIHNMGYHPSLPSMLICIQLKRRLNHFQSGIE